MTENGKLTANVDVDMNPNYKFVSEIFRTRSSEFEQKMVFLITGLTGATLTLLCPLYLSGSVEDARRWVVLFLIFTSSLSFIFSIVTSINFGKYLEGRTLEYLEKGNADAALRELKKTVRTLKSDQRIIDDGSELQLLKQVDFIEVSTSEGDRFESGANVSEKKSQRGFLISVLIYCGGVGLALVAIVSFEVLGII